MPYLRCPGCSRISHVVVWRVGSDTCPGCGEVLARAGQRGPKPPPSGRASRPPGGQPGCAQSEGERR